MLVFEHVYDSTEIYRAIPQVFEENEWKTVNPQEVRFALETFHDKHLVHVRYLNYERMSDGTFVVYVTHEDLRAAWLRVGNAVHLAMYWTYKDKQFVDRCLLRIVAQKEGP